MAARAGAEKKRKGKKKRAGEEGSRNDKETIN
jgi:hypothetical protein